MISLTESKSGKQYKITWMIGIDEKLKKQYALKEETIITIIQNACGSILMRNHRNSLLALSPDIACKIKVAEVL